MEQEKKIKKEEIQENSDRGLEPWEKPLTSDIKMHYRGHQSELLPHHDGKFSTNMSDKDIHEQNKNLNN